MGVCTTRAQCRTSRAGCPGSRCNCFAPPRGTWSAAGRRRRRCWQPASNRARTPYWGCACGRRRPPASASPESTSVWPRAACARSCACAMGLLFNHNKIWRQWSASDASMANLARRRPPRSKFGRTGHTRAAQGSFCCVWGRGSWWRAGRGPRQRLRRQRGCGARIRPVVPPQLGLLVWLRVAARS